MGGKYLRLVATRNYQSREDPSAYVHFSARHPFHSQITSHRQVFAVKMKQFSSLCRKICLVSFRCCPNGSAGRHSRQITLTLSSGGKDNYIYALNYSQIQFAMNSNSPSISWRWLRSLGERKMYWNVFRILMMRIWAHDRCSPPSLRRLFYMDTAYHLFSSYLLAIIAYGSDVKRINRPAATVAFSVVSFHQPQSQTVCSCKTLSLVNRIGPGEHELDDFTSPELHFSV